MVHVSFVQGTEVKYGDLLSVTRDTETGLLKLKLVLLLLEKQANSLEFKTLHVF